MSNKEETSQYPHLCLINYSVEKFDNLGEKDILIAPQLFEINNAGFNLLTIQESLGLVALQTAAMEMYGPPWITIE